MINSIIFNKLPEQVTIDGISYQINYGYRAMMAIEIDMFSVDKSDEQKLLNALNMFYLSNIPDNVEMAIEKMLWFHRCGEESSTGARKSRKKTRGYCFEQDAPLLYAAFRQQYNIDLRRTKSNELHWWEFSALFESLDENIKMAKVIYWRTCDLKGMTKKEKEFIKKIREIYAIKGHNSNMDHKMRLAKRNADMKEYVRKRMEECGKEKK